MFILFHDNFILASLTTDWSMFNVIFSNVVNQNLNTRTFNLLLKAWLTGQQIGDQCWFKFRIVQILIHIYVAVKSDDTVKHVKKNTSKRKQEHGKQNLYGDAVWQDMECFDWC